MIILIRAHIASASSFFLTEFPINSTIMPRRFTTRLTPLDCGYHRATSPHATGNGPHRRGLPGYFRLFGQFYISFWHLMIIEALWFRRHFEILLSNIDAHWHIWRVILISTRFLRVFDFVFCPSPYSRNACTTSSPTAHSLASFTSKWPTYLFSLRFFALIDWALIFSSVHLKCTKGTYAQPCHRL
jgi:hypothetical protein